MASKTPGRPAKRVQPTQPVDRPGIWRLEDARARLSEVVGLASSEGPQLVTVRGKEAAVVLAPETYRQLLLSVQEQQPLVDFLQGLDLTGIDTEREEDTGRDVKF